MNKTTKSPSDPVPLPKDGELVADAADTDMAGYGGYRCFGDAPLTTINISGTGNIEIREDSMLDDVGPLLLNDYLNTLFSGEQVPSSEHLARYTSAKARISEIVDMPDRLIDRMINLVYDNKGKLPVDARTQFFPELTDTEIFAMERVVLEGYAEEMGNTTSNLNFFGGMGLYMAMTRDELEALVPVQELNGKPAYIRLLDVPNPFRTECYLDHASANVPGQWNIWLWDWQRWLRARFSGRYQQRHNKLPKLVTDDMMK